MMHFVTLPLAAVPTPWAIAPVWTAVNTAALAVAFVLVLQLARQAGPLPAKTIALVGALWMGFQPLASCLAQGNIEIVELALLLAGLVLLERRRPFAAGAIVGCSTMIKYLPAGFLGWMAIRGYRRALAGSLVAMALVVAATALTLGWDKSATVRRAPTRVVEPSAAMHELSITSIFLHLTASVDSSVPGVLSWTSENLRFAQRAGLVTSTGLTLLYALFIWRQRRAPVAVQELSVLFILMVLVPPWNHDYYYVFTIVSLSIVIVTALDDSRGRRGMLAGVFTAYVMMSPPVPYGLIDRLGWFDMPFAHVWNLNDMPAFGALLLLALATRQWLTPSRR
jgi:hypothetical protein